VFGDFKTDDEFLEFFKEMGCFIENMSDKIIKELPPTQQRAARQEGVQPLADKIAAMQPTAIIISLKVIEKQAREAIALSGAAIDQVAVTPFPVKNMANVNNCINGVVAVLKSTNWP
jgi:hypothetical protein